MKLGISINIWDGHEMLGSCLTNMRPLVDHISVVYQIKSNHGQSIDKYEMLNTLVDLKDADLLDEVIEYEPNLNLKPHDNEINKRQLGYDKAKEVGCTHFLSMDCDEFYDPDEFNYAKGVLEHTNADSSICAITSYYGDYNHVIERAGYVPFIYKIKDDGQFKFGNQLTTKVHCDPTRQRTNSGTPIFFSRDELVMAHMSYVRNGENGMRLKLENSSARENWTDGVIEQMVDYYESWEAGMGGATIFNVHHPRNGRIIDNRVVIKPLEYVENKFK